MGPRAFLHDFVAFWVVIDPFAVLPVFLALTSQATSAERRQLAVASILVAAAVIGFFIACGQLLIESIGISLRAFQIAGGVVLFLFAVSLVLGETASRSPDTTAATSPFEAAVYPLAIPAISGPGTMLSAILLTDNARFGVVDQIQTGVSAAAVLFGATPITRTIGPGGANVLKRIMGMILAAVAANTVLTGLGSWLGLPRL